MFINSQKGNAVLIIVILLAIVLVGGYFWMNRGGISEKEEMEKIMNDEMIEGDEMMPARPSGGEESDRMDDTMTEEGDDVTTEDVKEFTLTGKNFEFSITEIEVKKGDKVKINFSSESGFHNWVVDEFDAQTKQLQADQSDSVEFVADKAGTFEFYCSIGQHREFGMVGKLVVKE